MVKSDATRFSDPDRGDEKAMAQFIDEKRYRPGLESCDRSA